MLPALPGGGARCAVAVGALDGAAEDAAYDGASAYATASIVKVDVLVALLLRAQEAGRALTSEERAYAVAMIEDSDNASATALWEAVGGAEGLGAANVALGLTGTVAGAGGLWGLTRTTARDQLALLRVVFDPRHSGLSRASRAYVASLMGRTAADQRWGVSAAADTGDGCALKNGWLPTGPEGLWVINSVGRVTVRGKACLVAVLSDGNATMEAGVALVERVAKAAVGVLCG
ncbi:serine hydrolase [Streptomyces sp. NPDC046821]|uniref:serine hydrolase n=1 Tax=Streptomyces sp. NPDC046821 TaxID=3154702 RepID=UPI0033F71599